MGMTIPLEKGTDWRAETDSRPLILFCRSDFLHLFRRLKVPMMAQVTDQFCTIPDCQILRSLRETAAQGCPTWIGQALQRPPCHTKRDGRN